jgi:hypothetical protein
MKLVELFLGMECGMTFVKYIKNKPAYGCAIQSFLRCSIAKLNCCLCLDYSLGANEKPKER